MSLDVLGLLYARDHGDYEGRSIEVWVGGWVLTLGYGRKR